MDALGGLGGLSGLAGQGGGDGFKDTGAHDHGKSDDFEDGPHGKGDSDGGKTMTGRLVRTTPAARTGRLSPRGRRSLRRAPSLPRRPRSRPVRVVTQARWCRCRTVLR